MQVLRLLARGLSTAEIACELFVSDATAKTHVSNVPSKLRLRHRVQAVILAYEKGSRGRTGGRALTRPGLNPRRSVSDLRSEASWSPGRMYGVHPFGW